MPFASSSIPCTPASLGISVDLDGYTNDTATNREPASRPIFGSSAFVLPEFVSAAEDGFRAAGFSDSYYYRIWVIPRITNLGNLVSNQIKIIELWNAKFEDETLIGRTVVGDDSGITLTGFDSGTFFALHSELYTLDALLAGSPTIDYKYLFTFDSDDVSPYPAFVEGRRVIPFPLRHNWDETIIEQITYKTDILPALSGKEQRLSLRETPRRRVEMSYVTMDALERADTENRLVGWQGRTYAVPLWMDSSRLTAPVTAGDQTFGLDTTNRDYDIGDFIFISNGLTYDILEIDSLTSGSVHTKTGALNSFPLGIKVCPARLGVIDSKFSFDRLTNIAEQFKIGWQLTADQISLNRRQAYSPVLYRGLEVYNVSNNYRDSISIDQEIKEDILDGDVGLFSKYAGEPHPRRTYPFAGLYTRDEIGQFFEFLFNRKGMVNPFWYVERVPAFKLALDEITTSSQITVVANGYSNLIAAADFRRDIAIRLPDRTWLYRRIESAADNFDGTETLVLNTTHGVALNVSDGLLISYLKCVRFASDMTEISYETNEVAQTATPFIDLLTTP